MVIQRENTIKILICFPKGGYMILNKLNSKQLHRLNNSKEQKIFDFITCSRQNEIRNKFIYILNLENGEKVVAQFNTEIELEEDNEDREKFCELSFIVLKILKKNKDSKLRKNKILYFNYKNCFESFELLEKDEGFTEILLPHQFSKYDFEGTTNILTCYNKEYNIIKMKLLFHPYMQNERFKLSAKSDVEILITFFDVSNVQGVKNNDIADWDVWKVCVIDNNICFKTCSDIEDWTSECDMNEIKFNFNKAELRVVKDEFIGYYKGKYLK